MSKLILPLLLALAAGCHFADTPSTPQDAAAISGYNADKQRSASEAAYHANRK